MIYIAPKSGLKAYTCPHCGVLARQYHFYSNSQIVQGRSGNSCNANLWRGKLLPFFDASDFEIRYSLCENCKKVCIWRYDQMVYPNRGSAPVPNPDMPEDVKKDYEEAASIYIQSPRGAAALLRLAIQKLCVDLGGKGKNINDDIKTLVEKGLPSQVQQSLDIVRVVGNDAVHPGQIDTDNPEVVGKLFGLLNIITDYMVSMPKKISDMYSDLTDSSVEQIKKRDGQ